MQPEPRRSPRKSKNTKDSSEKKKKKKPTDLVVKNKGKKKVSRVKKKNQSLRKRKRDMATLEKEGGQDSGSSASSRKKTRRTFKPNRERETEALQPHTTVAQTEDETDLGDTEQPLHLATSLIPDHEIDSPETEKSPQLSPVSPTQSQQHPSSSGSSTKSPSPELQEKEETRSTNSAPQAAEDIAVEPIRPKTFFFKSKDYWKSCKLQSRCHQHKFMETLKGLDESEKRWFLEHPQFKHLMHMDCKPHRKMMGLWMMLIRTIATPKRRQVWFAVNGVPIRYSIREHGLISGLYCHQYPEKFMSRLNMKFAEKHFRKMFMKKLKLKKNKKKKKPEEEELKVTVLDVEEKLSQMQLDRSNDRLKIAVLYFLTTDLHGRTKFGSSIDPFLLKLLIIWSCVKAFPWGRFTLNNRMDEIFHVKDHFIRGLPENPKWTFPGFINPLEILAFECIPVLKAEFREPMQNHDPTCPRMWKWKFTSTGTTGYALEELYKTLGDTKEICSILTPIEREQDLLYEIMDEGCWEDVELLDDGDDHDAIVDGWNKFIIREGGKIFWEDIYKEDIKSRSLEIEQQEGEQLEEEEHETVAKEPERIRCGEPVANLESLKEMMMSLITAMEGRINNKIEGLDTRLKVLEGNSILREGFGIMDFQYDHYEAGGTSAQKDKDNEDNDKEPDMELEDDEADKDKEDDGKEPDMEHEETEKDEGKELEDNDAEKDEESEKELQEEPENESEKEFEKQPEIEATYDDANVEEEAAKKDDAEKDLEESEKELQEESEKELVKQPELEATYDDANVEVEAARKETITRSKRVSKPSHVKKSPFVKQ
ncbi:hypothetical protein Bca101_087799 [Brassica carinata]